MGHLGRSLPGQRRGDQPAQVPAAPQGPHGRAHPRTAARPAGPGAHHQPNGAQAAEALLAAARQAQPGETFTAAGQTLTRSVLTRTAPARIWADDPGTGKRRDLSLEEDHAFWAWAAVEVLRLTGCRAEELTEITHHSLVQYRLPTTGELVPLLQIAPSKTDEERLLLVSPELADVLSAIIRRLRGPAGTVPLVPLYDRHECVWLAPSPLLFQRSYRAENRAISERTIRKVLHAALAHTGLIDPADGLPLHYTPHDFRRIFITDAILSGLPPHIAQVIAGHRDINVTMGYKAVYPEEAIQAHLAFLARRRAPAALRGIPCPHRAGMAGIPRPFRAPQGRDRNMRPRFLHPVHS